MGSSVLETLVGGDQVRELRSSRPPSHSQGTIIATTVAATIGSSRVGTGVLTNDSEELGVVKGKRASVLEDDASLGSSLTDVALVVVLDVDSEVDLFAVLLSKCMDEAEGVAGPGGEVDVGEVLYRLSNLEEGRHDS